jgi:hypothetical protein
MNFTGVWPIFCLGQTAVNLARPEQILQSNHLIDPCIFNNLPDGKAGALAISDEVARNGALQRITSARGFLERPLHFSRLLASLSVISTTLSQHQLFLHIDTRLAQELSDGVWLKPRRVKPHPHRTILFIEVDSANAVNLAHAIDGPQFIFSGRGTVTESNVQVGHPFENPLLISIDIDADIDWFDSPHMRTG